ncbi:hypothetical protein AAP_06173 [Ascosphaera apis ARSEF 7405]|uniref:Uncharacterized protein n=1 Tax=Ascosphaera apis ARSEF 7405 TaxID=392613 RepID=A0A167UZU4_9EURO|nr:hypothetical protein AAP_06173 [Ascosphaera apis ARSEF 7405]
MAPRPSPSNPSNNPIAPLADFFWIAGVDGVELYDKFRKLGEEYQLTHGNGNGNGMIAAGSPPNNGGAGGAASLMSTSPGTISAMSSTIAGNDANEYTGENTAATNNININNSCDYNNNSGSGNSLDPTAGHHNAAARTSSLLQDPTANTIEEDADAEEEGEEEDYNHHFNTASSYNNGGGTSTAGGGTNSLDPRLSTITAHRLTPAREPSESRLSFRSLASDPWKDAQQQQERETHSNRSSMTIKEQRGAASVRTSYTVGSGTIGAGSGGYAATTTTGTSANGGTAPSFMSDDEFDKALLKFASDRDSFLNDLSLSTPASASAVMNRAHGSSAGNAGGNSNGSGNGDDTETVTASDAEDYS